MGSALQSNKYPNDVVAAANEASIMLGHFHYTFTGIKPTAMDYLRH